jgi:predicted enzyme related to lactoylglutathione lyase
MSFNPIGWFEIYVEDMDRAQKFYEEVFKVELQDLPMEGMSMRSFPGDYDKPGATGTLVKMEGMNPGSGGTMVYFGCEDCAIEESRVEAAGGKVVQAKMAIGEHGFCSMVLDTEGNTIGLHSMG